jgi:hypothetical protein
MASYDSTGHYLRDRLIGITSQSRMVAANASKAQSDGYSNLLDTRTVSPAPCRTAHAGAKTDPQTVQ